MDYEVVVKSKGAWRPYRSIEAVKRELLTAIIRGDWLMKPLKVYRLIELHPVHIVTLTPYYTMSGSIRVRVKSMGYRGES